MKSKRLTIGVPTRDRPKSLGRLLASLSAQTFQDFDLVIVDDSRGDMLDRAGELWLEALERGDRRVEIVEGVRINQTYAHNAVLWSRDANELIFRMDDDVSLQPDFLEKLVQTWTELEAKGHNIGAMGGVYFTEHLRPRDENPPIPTRNHPPTNVAPDGALGPWAQMVAYSDDEPFRAEHLYSSWLYSRDAMRAVGGFPLVYSVGVSYHEETDASYRLHLAGYELYVVPSALGTHSHEDTGGTRYLPSSEHRRRAESDWNLFLKRLPRLRGVNWRPSVAVYSDHWRGVGGGQRLTYSLVEFLHSHEELFGGIDLVCPPHEEFADADFVLEHYGIDLRAYDGAFWLPQPGGHDWGGAVYDVVISIGHHPPDMAMIPPRRHHIHYSLYPMQDLGVPRGVDRHVAISGFSADGVLKNYRRNADVIYPYVDQPGDPSDIEKENLILIVGRLIGKGVEELAHIFLTMDLPSDTKLIVVVPKRDESEGYSRIERLSQHPRIELRAGLSRDELRDLYRRAKILWAARGFRLPEHPTVTNREHFGYTPVEALSCYCLPLAFHAGGYLETSIALWSNVEELTHLTETLVGNRDAWEGTLKENLGRMHLFSKEQFALDWTRVITSTNALAWQSSVENRHADMPDIGILKSEVHLACIVEHPGRPTGYGIVSKEILRGLAEAGFNLHVFAIDGTTPDLYGDYASFWTNPKDRDEIKKNFLKFISHRTFDAAVVAYDPFVSMGFIKTVSIGSYRIPIVAFVSQEGLPPSLPWDTIVQKADKVITYCRTGAEAVTKHYGRPVDWVHLGLDHAPFEQYSDGDRKALRQMMGWQDRFVIMNVSRNARNKNIASLIKVASILRNDYGHDDVILFLHTSPMPEKVNIYHGVDLKMYASLLGIPATETIVFSPMPLRGYVPYETDLEKALGLGVPIGKSKQGKWMREDLGMIGRYNLADLYLDMSSVEGWGLPALEAMACGVPVMSVNDGFARSEVINHSSLLPASPGSIWITGADMMEASPTEVARRIEVLRTGESWDTLTVRGDVASQVVGKLKWDKAREKIVEAVKECLE